MTVSWNHQRSGLICDEKQNIIELFWHAWQGGCHAGGCFRWIYFPHVHAIAGCIGDGSGTCHLLIAQHGHLWFLQVSCSYWTTCWVPIVPHVSFLWAHVSCCGWIMCHFFIGPCGVFLLVHVAISYSTTCHDTVRPCFAFLFGHVAWRHPSMCRIFSSPSVVLWLFLVSFTGSSMCRFLFDHVAYSGSTIWSTINSS